MSFDTYDLVDRTEAGLKKLSWLGIHNVIAEKSRHGDGVTCRMGDSEYGVWFRPYGDAFESSISSLGAESMIKAVWWSTLRLGRIKSIQDWDRALKNFADKMAEIQADYGTGEDMDNEMVASELVSAAKELIAIDFPTKGALDKYLKDHPDADRSNHHVVETKKEHHPIVQRVLSEKSVADIGQFSSDEKKALDRAVRDGILKKGKGGGYPKLKTVYSHPEFDIDGDRKRIVRDMEHLAMSCNGEDMGNELVAQELVRVAKELMAIDFPTKAEYDKYLKDHPDADRSNHRVVETKKAPAKKEEPKKSGGSGWGSHKKGKAVKSLSDVKVGDVLVTHSKQFDSQNVFKVTKVNPEGGPSAGFDGHFVDPNDTSKKRMPSDDTQHVWPHDLEKEEYFKAEK